VTLSGDDLFDEDLATRRVAVEDVFARLKSSLGLQWPAPTAGGTTPPALATSSALASFPSPNSSRASASNSGG